MLATADRDEALAAWEALYPAPGKWTKLYEAKLGQMPEEIAHRYAT